jgi:hypothetical protein
MLSELGLNNANTTTSVVIILLAIWSILWKGCSLWISAREKKTYWFIFLLIFNTVGILDIVYIFFFSEWGKKYVAGLRKHRILKKVSPKIKKEKGEDK